ncbi:MAG: PAS domain-containing protein [Saprospiraceae bacterium]
MDSNSYFNDFFESQNNWEKLSVKITDLIEFDNLNEFKESLHSIHSTENTNPSFNGKIKVGDKFESIKVTINHPQKENKEWANYAVELTCQKIEDLPVESGIPEQIFKNSPINIFTVDRNYCLTFHSKSVVSILEFLLKEKPVIGKSFFTNELQKVEWKNNFDIVFSDEKIFVEKNYKKGKKEFYDLLILSPLKNENQEIEGCIVCVNDILKLKNEEVNQYQNHKKFQHLFDNNFLGIGVLDENNVMNQANTTFCKLLGIENNNFEKYRVNDFIFGDELKLLTKKIKEIYRNEISHFTSEIKLRDTNGKIKYAQLILNGLYKNNIFKGCLITIMDISTQKEIQIKEQELKELKSKEKSNLEHQMLLQHDLDSRIRELTTNQMLITKKNNLIHELGKKLEEIVKQPESKIKPSIRKIISSIKRQNVFDDDWENLKIHFVKMHPSFLKKLIARSSKITEKDLRHCAYIKLGFSAKETSSLLGTLPRSIEQARFRIKKKLNLPVDQKLKDYLRSI